MQRPVFHRVFNPKHRVDRVHLQGPRFEFAVNVKNYDTQIQVS